MSCKLMERAVALAAPISHAAFRVLMVLAKHANDDGTNCYPSMQTIEDMGQMTRDSVVRCLEQLTAVGLITSERRKGRKGNTYALHLINGHTTSPFTPKAGDNSVDKSVDSSANSPTIGLKATTPTPRKSPTTRPLTSGNSPIVGGNGPTIGPDSLYDSKKEREGNKPFEGKEGSEAFPSDPELLADPAAVKAAVGGYLGRMRGSVAAAPGCWPQRTQAEQLEQLDAPPQFIRPNPVEPLRSVEEQLAILLGAAHAPAMEAVA